MTRAQLRQTAWLTSFGDRTVELVCKALQAEWGVFFLLDETSAGYGYCSRGAPADLPLRYTAQNMELHDPLHPRRLAQDQRRFTTIFDPSLFADSRSRNEQRHFWAFLQSFGACDAAEMIFWNGPRPVAGVSLIWRKRTSRCRDIALAASLQSYIEFNLLAPSSGLPTGASAACMDELTSREHQIASLVCRGCTNAEIAKLLGVSLATVKTHLLHVFSKANVNNRAALAHYMSLRATSRQPRLRTS